MRHHVMAWLLCVAVLGYAPGAVAEESAARERPNAIWLNPLKPILGILHLEYQRRLGEGWGLFVNSEWLFLPQRYESHPAWVSTLGWRWFPWIEPEAPWLEGGFGGARVGHSFAPEESVRHDLFVGVEIGYAYLMFDGWFGLMGRAMVQWSVRAGRLLPGGELLIGVQF